jgi:hypothetical protein
MHRQGQQYGPYTAVQLLQMHNSRQLDPADQFFMSGGQSWLSLQQALPTWQIQSPSVDQNGAPYPQSMTTAPAYASMPQPAGTPGGGYQQPDYQGNPPKRKKKHGCLISFLVFVLVVAGTFAVLSLTRKSDLIQTGRSRQLVTDKIGSGGGTVAVDDPGHDLDGLSLTVPAGAYEKSQSFKVSARPVDKHKLGKQIELLTPLISIDNGHGFSAEPMLLTIPIDLKEGQFAMGFYYDRKSGALEGIPFAELASDHITLVTHHFSDLIVAAADLQTLVDMTVDTGYRPGLDDWQFVNRGSSIAAGGHCAGQSLTSMFYFTEIHLGQKQPRLFGRFDNNRYGARTATFQDDDSWGYRFSSVAQKEMAWNTRSLKLQHTIGKASDLYSLAAFAFAMQLTGEPQFVYIAGQTTLANGQPYSYAHAIVAYRIENGQIYVADPNYPGQIDRTINFGQSGVFQPYGSGANADDIASNGVLPFTSIRYLAKSALVDYSRLHDQYKLMQKGEIGNGLFPEYKIEYLQAVDPKTGEETWVELKEDLELTSEDTEKAGENMRGKLKIRFSNPDTKTMQYTPYTGLSLVNASRSWSMGAGGWRMTTYTLKEGVTHYGFKIEHEVGGRNKYTDFLRVQIVYDKQADLAMGQQEYRVISGQEMVYTAKVKDAPAQPEYNWDFGDGKDPVITREPTVKFTYTEPGDYVLTLTLTDTKTGKTLAMADAPVESLDLFGTWQLDYTIETSGIIDKLITEIVKVIGRMFAQIFDTEIDDADFEVTLKGTVIGCVMEVLPPAAGQPDGPIRIRLQQLTSSTDFVEPTEEIWEGILTLKDDQVLIKITAEGQPVGITFRGTLSQGLLYGEMDATVFSGSFQAVR